MAGNNSNEVIKKAIQKIVQAGAIKDFEVLTGFVSKIYQVGEDNYGTIDFISMDGSIIIPGVSIASLDGNRRGKILLPAEDSDVTIAIIGGSDAYVLHFSHLDTAIFDVDKSIKVGATGVEDTDVDTDYDEVAETGLKTETEHTPSAITTKADDVSGSNDKHNTLVDSAEQSEKIIEDLQASKSTKVTQTSTTHKIESDSSSIETKEQEVVVTSPKITLSNGGNVEKAVLGETLKTVLDAFIDQVAQILTTTVMGPQPILNAAAVTALKSQVNNILSDVNLIE